MKNSEDAVEKVLAGLRDAEAPTGIERRILDALEKREAVRSRSGWRGFWQIWSVVPGQRIAVRYVVGGAALAGVFVLALAVPAIRRLGHTPAQAKIAGPLKSASVAPSEVAAKDAGRSSRGGDVRRTGKTNAPTARVERAADSAGSVDSVALSLREMHAASYPAPPMPLTEQERLLLRIAHKRDPVELAMLDPKLRDIEEMKEKAEFQRFFASSTVKQITPGEQAMREQSAAEPAAPQPLTTEQTAPAQAVPEQAVPEQPTQEQPRPEKVGPDQSNTQQPTPRPTTTGENK